MALYGESGYALIKPFGRALATFIPDCVIEEGHSDRYIPTQHPVEGGGLISDHVYKTNPNLELRYGFSDSSAGEAGYSRQTYAEILQLADSKRLITVYTGKRAYRSMVITGLATTTNEATENSLLIIIALEQLTITSIQTTSTDTASSNSSNQSDPASTGSVGDQGTQAATDASPQDLGGELSTPNQDPSYYDQPGLAQPDPIVLPEVETPPAVDYSGLPDAQGVDGLQGASPDYYNMFGGGP